MAACGKVFLLKRICKFQLQTHRCLADASSKKLKSMPVTIGEVLPDTIVYENTPQNSFPIHDVFKGKKGILFAVVGAFMPGCKSHVPEYLNFYDKFQEAGYKTIACISVNDPFVMEAWGKDVDPEHRIHMLSDMNGDFTRSLGTQLDSAELLGDIRSRRYGLLIDDNVITAISSDKDHTGLACLLCIQRMKGANSKTKDT